MRDGVREGHRNPGGVGFGEIIALVASRECQTRVELVRATGLSRSTVAQRIDALLERGVLVEDGGSLQSGGRPARRLELNGSFRLVAAVDIGEDHVRAALTDLQLNLLAEHTAEIDVHAGPDVLLELVGARIEELLAEVGRPASDLLGIGLAIPAPVDFPAQRVVGFSVLSGWDGYEIADSFRARFGAPVLADNDVNLRALSQHRRAFPDTDYLLYVKAGTGIGSGIIAHGALYRGAQGAAGDIGHIQLRNHEDPLCRCGNVGCVEALAAGWAVSASLRALGMDVSTASDVVARAADGEALAIQALRTAGRAIGEAVSYATSLLNPSVIVLGGTLARSGDHLLAGVREVVYQRALPLATRHLEIVTEKPDEHDGVLGAAQLVIDNAMSPRVTRKLLLS